MGASSDTAICLSVCLSIPAIDAQLSWAIGTQTACSLAMCGLRTRPRTDVDPPRVELPSAGGISSRRPRGDNLFYCLFVLYVQQGHAVHCRFRPRHPLHSGLDQSRPPSRRRRDQYCAAGALACTRRRSDVTRCSGIDMTSPCGQLCADVTSAVKPEVGYITCRCAAKVACTD